MAKISSSAIKPATRSDWSLLIGCASSDSHFVDYTVEFLQGFSFHRQLQLRVLFEDLRIALSKQLPDPLVFRDARTEPRSICGVEDKRRLPEQR
jgi:hypothetical protein